MLTALKIQAKKKKEKKKKGKASTKLVLDELQLYDRQNHHNAYFA